MNRTCRVHLDFFPESMDKGVDRPGDRKFIIPPDFIQNGVAVDDASLMPDEKFQEAEFFRCQNKFPVPSESRPLFEIQPDIGEMVLSQIREALLRAPQYGFDAGQ